MLNKKTIKLFEISKKNSYFKIGNFIWKNVVHLHHYFDYIMSVYPYGVHSLVRHIFFAHPTTVINKITLGSPPDPGVDPWHNPGGVRTRFTADKFSLGSAHKAGTF